MTQYPEKFLERLKAITDKRPKTVIDHILEHGFITTEDLARYGYIHPPRAARDVRELGIPLETYRVKNSNGRSIAAYRFGDLSKVRYDRLGGRKVLPKKFKTQLVEETNWRCGLCGTHFEPGYFQIDHRVPYEITGDSASEPENASLYMPLCLSCNRTKSWSCEHCLNWLETKSPEICQSCYWAHPESYNHIALRKIRRLEIVWGEAETAVYDQLKRRTEELQQTLSDGVKSIIKSYLDKN